MMLVENVTKRGLVYAVLLVSVLAIASSTPYAQPEEGAEIEPFQEEDVFSRLVNLNDIPDTDFVTLLFFSREGSERLAMKLRAMKKLHKDRVYVAAVGLDEDRAELKTFADEYDLNFFVLPDTEAVAAEKRYGPFVQRPITFIVDPVSLTLLHQLKGGGATADKLLSAIAGKYLEQEKPEPAKRSAGLALLQGEDPVEAQQAIGYANLQEGNVDEANAVFDRINMASGKAMVALQAGDVDGAIAIAKAAGGDDAFAAAVLGKALMTAGDQGAALEAFAAAAKSSEAMPDYQATQALNGHGRLLHASGDMDAAKAQYELAHKSSYYAVGALTNLAAAYQEEGEGGSADLKESLEKAQALLNQAQGIATNIGKQDQLLAMLSRDIADALSSLADTERNRYISERVEKLGELFRKMKEEGAAEPADLWTSRRRVIAISPARERSAVFFERAGTELALRRAIQRALDEHEAINVVDRDEIEGVIQELELSANDLASADTQLRLGEIFNAGILGFVEFGPGLGNPGGIDLIVRAIDAETTALAEQFAIEGVQDDSKLQASVQEVTDKFVAALNKDPLQGVIAAEPDGENVVVGLGSNYLVKPGTRFMILQEGPKVVIRGEEKPGPLKPVGEIEITAVRDGDISEGKVTRLNEGAEIGIGTKLKEIRTQ